jgi:hypothetical protein
MNWFKSFWKNLTTPPAERPPTLEQIFGGTAPARSSASPFDETLTNFTPRAQQVLLLARKEAERFNHGFVGTEHLLLGLIKLGQGVSVNVLKKQGVDLETVRAEIEKQVGTGPDQKIIGKIPDTPRVKKVLDLASKEARALNHTYIGTEHILLGLLREGDGVAARVLRQMNVDVEKTRQDILKELDPNHALPADSPSMPGLVPLKPASLPQGEAVDTSQRYDVYCAGWNQETTVYRNVRFKGVKYLFKQSQYGVLCDYVELEQENGQSIFVSRVSIIKFAEPGP